MNAAYSNSAGLCYFEHKGSFRLVRMPTCDLVESFSHHQRISEVSDWEELTASNIDELTQMALQRYYAQLVISNIETCLSGISPKLQLELLSEAEETLVLLTNQSDITRKLMRAPLLTSEKLESLISFALVHTNAGIARHLTEMKMYQPILRSIAAKWLSLSNLLFASRAMSRCELWRLAVDQGVIVDSCKSTSYLAVKNAWLKLLYLVNDAASRISLQNISDAMASLIYPTVSDTGVSFLQSSTDLNFEDSEDNVRNHTNRYNHDDELKRVLKQIQTITSEVAAGNDIIAKRYINELVESQIQRSGSNEHAVKSLCNIAQRCAELFRSDFEYECLHKALQLIPTDGWTLVQLADHYKRTGEYREAISVLDKSRLYYNDQITDSLLADIHISMGDYAGAMQIYKSVVGSNSDPRLRTAIASIHRKSGDLTTAFSLYNELLNEGVSSTYIDAGLADIATKQGNLDLANQLYQKLLGSDINDCHKVSHLIALSSVLVRKGDLQGAYNRLDQAVIIRPFARRAYVLRSVVEGLLGKSTFSIADVPLVENAKTFDQWVSNFIRGLLLLLLDRYSDAADSLASANSDVALNVEQSSLMQLGSVVSLLRNRTGVRNASNILRKIPELKDSFASTIRDTFMYHVAVSNRNNHQISVLKDKLSSVKDLDLLHLIRAIEDKRWTVANDLEIRALLRLCVSPSGISATESEFSVTF